MQITEGWFSRTTDVPGVPRLFYFPFAGGNPAAVLPWQDELAESVELQVAALPGRGVRLFETPLDDLAELVDRLTDGIADRTDRPFAFFGYSLGALVAFEVARELRRRGLPGPMCLWAVGCEGPQTRSEKQRLHDLPQAELIATLRDYGGTPTAILDDAELAELLLPGIRADFALNERYQYRPEPPLELPIIVLRSTDDPYVEAARAAGWALESTRPLQEHCYQGDHFFVEPHRAQVIGLVRDTITDLAANPYRALPARSFWRSAVAEPAPAELTELWQPGFTLGPDDPIITAGSCFARELGQALLAAGLNFYDAELPPPGLSRAEQLDRHYGQFSFRTGNIYTARMLRQWLSWAVGESAPPTGSWLEGNRFVDGYRPAVEPDGYRSEAELLAARDQTLAAIRTAVGQARCLIFTLGLTEAWRDTVDGTEYPVCPGTVRGRFDPRRHVFHNAVFAEVHSDLTAALGLARSINPELRVVLTVSPVPLTATATGGHALVASSYSKSVLRAVSGQLAAEHDFVDYFPSYELITGAPFRSGFFEPNLRTVSADGVGFVLRHFLGAVSPGLTAAATTGSAGGDPACDDAVLDYYRTG